MSKTNVIILASGDIRHKLKFLKINIPCPALIPINTKPISYYILDYYDQKPNLNIYLCIERSQKEIVQKELQNFNNKFNIITVNSTDGVISSLEKSLKAIPYAQETIINPVTTIPCVIPKINEVIIANKKKWTSEWSCIDFENKTPILISKNEPGDKYGYGFTGSGETIAIIDAGFNTSHNELNAKTITQYGTQTAATGANATADHGLIVSSVAAGEDDGTGMQGVAPSASLHLASYNQSNGNTYYPTHWANATDNASSAIAQNNSWGINYQIDTLQSDISSNSWSNAYGIAQKFHSSGYTANEASANTYITALNNFQDHGVIVYALSNTTSYTNADFQAALPVLFSNLEEAWITAVNVEITGSSGNETYTRKSAPCGVAGKYCLGADGFQVNGAAYDSRGTNYYWQGASGTSFVAPMISGAVALLAEAFPNHSPGELTDRLIASADNSFFSHSDAVYFHTVPIYS